MDPWCATGLRSTTPGPLARDLCPVPPVDRLPGHGGQAFHTRAMLRAGSRPAALTFNTGALIISIGFGDYYTITIIRNPRNLILIIKAPSSTFMYQGNPTTPLQPQTCLKAAPVSQMKPVIQPGFNPYLNLPKPTSLWVLIRSPNTELIRTLQ